MPTISFTYEQEEMLIAGLHSGNRQAFDKLYKTYAPALLGYINRIVSDENSAEKILQRAFVEIWDKREKYDACAGRLFTWLMKQVKNTAMNYLAIKQKKGAGKNQKIPLSVNMSGTSHENEHEMHNIVLDLLYYNNYSLKEASSIMNVTEDKLKCTLRSAIKNLKTLSHD